MTGGDRNDVLGSSTNGQLIGGGGDNQYFLGGPGNVIVQGPTGVNTVTTWMSYTLPDNIQNLNVGGSGLYGAGNALDNIIKVDNGNNLTLYGAGGNNVLVGGTGTNTFIIDGTAGSNAIYGWNSGDILRLLGGSLKTFADVQANMRQQGSDVVIKNGGNDVVIRNTTISQFSAADFYLSLDPSKLGALTFNDNFNSLSLRSGSNPTGTWSTSYHYGGIGSYTLTGNGELQIYTAPGFKGTTTQDLGLNPFSLTDGVLTIRAQQVDAATSAGMWNYKYSSGVITTKQSFAQTYGYFEMRADLPDGVAGAWPAFWLVPADGSWPPELDVMETLSGTQNIDYTTVHSAASGSHTAVGSANLVVDPSGYHSYGVLWTKDRITWFLDGQQVFETATPADMHKPMYMIANMAVGGWAGTPNFSSADMQIDYIRAYALADGSSTWTSSVAGPLDTSIPAAGTTGGSTGSTGSTGTTGGSTGSTGSTGGTTGSTGSTNGSSTTVGSGSTTTTTVSTSAANYTAPTGVTKITLTGSGQTVIGNDAGDTFVSNNTGNRLTGGAGADTFILGRGADMAKGGAGADKFVFNETPWASGRILDFSQGDSIELAGMLAKSGYKSGDPLAGGFLKLVRDGSGSTQIWSNLDKVSPGSGWWLVTTVDGVAPTALQLQGTTLAFPPPDPKVSTAAASYTAPPGVTTITLTGAFQQVVGNDAGNTFLVANNSGNRITGGAGADVFQLGRGGDVVTGGGGADTFTFKETPWTPGRITDFNPAQDTLDLTGLILRSGYSGSDPIGAGYLQIRNDAKGHAQIWSNLDHVAGAGWWLVTTLEGVSASSVSLQNGVVKAAGGTAPVVQETISAEISTAAAAFTAALGVTKVSLTGFGQSVHVHDAGATIVSNNAGNQLWGGAGADTFFLGRGGDVVAGGAGADLFVFKEAPWKGARITDFQPGEDSIDLSGILARAGYAGSDPVRDQYLKMSEDASGQAQVWANLDTQSAKGYWWLVTTLEGVSSSSVHLDGAFVAG